MKFELWVIGKTKEKHLKEGLIQTLHKISHYTDLQYIEIANIKYKSKQSGQLIQSAEKDVIGKKLKVQDVLILLDEKGKKLNSRQFAKEIENMMQFGSRRHVFLIGGAYGFDPELYARAEKKISLSPMTFSHQLIRLIFLEQFYRAMTIIRGEGYHND